MIFLEENYIIQQNIDMQTQQYQILRTQVPKSLAERGRLLYSSKVVHPQSKQKITAQIYSKMIVMGDSYIPFLFQIRFFIKQSTIEFDYQENLLILQLLDKDQLQWKQFLKNYLNQKGFHQQFKPIKKIGKGNFASVYLVEKLDNHQNFAVKAFSKEAAYSQQNGKQCLIKEIQIMRQLNHKNTMKLYEVFQSQNSLYFVFQLIQGGSLHEKIKQKYRFKAEQVQFIIKGLLQGLTEMHNKKIMHRDLKPQNILLRKKQSLECVIADFGLAQFTETQMYLFTRCGTPGFVAPQVINIKDMKAKYSPICDIFSLGLIFYMLLFGKSLFKSKNYNDLVKQNRQSKFNFQEKQFSLIQKETKDLLMKTLRVNPQERITAQQALQHPYFKLSFNDSQNQSEQQADKVEVDLGSNAIAITPPLNQVQKPLRVKKDSCIEFKLGKENILNGKTQSIQNVASTKVSMGNNMLKGVKASKFTARNKQNTTQLSN